MLVPNHHVIYGDLAAWRPPRSPGRGALSARRESPPGAVYPREISGSSWSATTAPPPKGAGGRTAPARSAAAPRRRANAGSRPGTIRESVRKRANDGFPGSISMTTSARGGEPRPRGFSHSCISATRSSNFRAGTGGRFEAGRQDRKTLSTCDHALSALPPRMAPVWAGKGFVQAASSGASLDRSGPTPRRKQDWAVWGRASCRSRRRFAAIAGTVRCSWPTRFVWIRTPPR